MRTTANVTTEATPTIDPQWIDRIVREVLCRLQQETAGQQKPKSIANTPTEENQIAENQDTEHLATEKLVTVATVQAWATSGRSQITMMPGAIVTPAARDEAKQRGITITTAASATKQPVPTISVASDQHAATAATITDSQDPERAAIIAGQLAKRQIRLCLKRGLTLSGEAGNARENVSPPKGQTPFQTEPRLSKNIVLSDTPSLDVFRFCGEKGLRAVMVAQLADVERFAGELSPQVWVLDMKRLNLIAAVNVAARIQGLN